MSTHIHTYIVRHTGKKITWNKDTEDAEILSFFVLTSVITSYNVTVGYIVITAVRGLWKTFFLLKRKGENFFFLKRLSLIYILSSVIVQGHITFV